MLTSAFRIAAAATAAVLTTAPGAAAAHRPEHLTLTVTTTTQQIVGTTYLESDTVTRDGETAGLALLTCPRAAQNNVAIAHCTADLGLQGGTLQLQIANDNTTGAVTGRITSGTGTFSGWDGRVTGQGSDTGAVLTLSRDRH